MLLRPYQEGTATQISLVHFASFYEEWMGGSAPGDPSRHVHATAGCSSEPPGCCIALPRTIWSDAFLDYGWIPFLHFRIRLRSSLFRYPSPPIPYSHPIPFRRYFSFWSCRSSRFTRPPWLVWFTRPAWHRSFSFWTTPDAPSTSRPTATAVECAGIGSSTVKQFFLFFVVTREQGEPRQ